jgi:hypothetical protein
MMSRFPALRRLGPAIAAALLAGCATFNLPPVGAPVPAPEPRVGDAWNYKVLDGFRGFERGAASFAVTGVQGETFTAEVDQSGGPVTRSFTLRWRPRAEGTPAGNEASGEGGAVTRTFARGWNPRDGRTPAGDEVTYDPPLPLFVFPLEDGRRWTQTVTATDTRTGARFPVFVQGWVLGRETVTTPAGTFDAIRIQRSLRIGDGETSIWRSDTFQSETEWYAPAVGRAVRYRQDLNYYFDKMRGREPMGNRIEWGRVQLELTEHGAAPR